VKLLAIKKTPDGYRYPEAWIAFGTCGNGVYLQFMYGRKTLDTYKDFMTNKMVTRWRRKAIRFHLSSYKAKWELNGL